MLAWGPDVSQSVRRTGPGSDHQGPRTAQRAVGRLAAYGSCPGVARRHPNATDAATRAGVASGRGSPLGPRAGAERGRKNRSSWDSHRDPDASQPPACRVLRQRGRLRPVSARLCPAPLLACRCNTSFVSASDLDAPASLAQVGQFGVTLPLGGLAATNRRWYGRALGMRITRPLGLPGAIQVALIGGNPRPRLRSGHAIAVPRVAGTFKFRFPSCICRRAWERGIGHRSGARMLAFVDRLRAR